MKKTLFLFVMLLWVGSTFAQSTANGMSIEAIENSPYAQSPYEHLIDGKPLPPDFLDYEPLPPIKPLEIENGRMPVTTVYSDRAVFEAACANIVLENFNMTGLPNPTACECPVSSTNPGICYGAGNLIPGFAYGDFGAFAPCSLPGAIALWPPGGFGAGNTSYCVLPNYFVQNGRLEITTPGTRAVGFDFDDHVGAIFGLGGLTYQITVFNGATNLGTFAHTAAFNAVNFWGVEADEDITRIQIVGPGNALETIDNLVFGTCAPVGGGGDCLNNACVSVTCPPDATVACIDLVDLDPALAIVSSVCAAEAGRWVTNPEIDGAPGCPGTTYTYLYKAVDAGGEIGCCERIITIDNTPAVLTVIPGGTVDCPDDISVDLSDATVTNSCADYNLYIAAPEVNGVVGCPGTTYTYTFRLIDVCGRVVETDRVFTQAANAGPSVTAPADLTTDCLASVTPNPDNATTTTSCGLGATVTVAGPQILGPVDCPTTVYRYTYTVTDDCGRTATDTQDFKVANSAPVFSNCPGDNWLVLNCEDYGGEGGTIAVIQAWIASVTASTSCGIPLTVFNNFNPNNINTCLNNGYNTVTFRATDNCGRTSFCTGVYVVVDTEGPNITTPAQDHWEMCNYNTQANLTAWVQAHGGAIASDGCSTTNISWQASPANPQINCIGATGTTTVTVQFIVTDNCGNKSNTTATFNALASVDDFNDNGGSNQLNQEKGLTLLQNRPNPFKDETLISFNLPEATYASLTIYDVDGRTLKVIEGNYNAGYNEVGVSASDLGATGVMYYRLMTDNGTVTKTMLVID